MSIWNSNKQLYVLPCLLRSAFSEFLDQSKLVFFVSFLLPSFLSVFAFFYYTWSCRVMSLASVVDIFGQESRRLLQRLVSVSGIPKWKRTATSWTGCFVTVNTKTCFNYQLNAQFLYSITVCMLHYNPRHVSSINMPIFRRTNCIITASGIVTLCKRLYSMPDDSRLSLYSRLQRVTIPYAVILQFVLLKMGMLMF